MVASGRCTVISRAGSTISSAGLPAIGLFNPTFMRPISGQIFRNGVADLHPAFLDQHHRATETIGLVME